jgi:hypothetical protein
MRATEMGMKRNQLIWSFKFAAPQIPQRRVGPENQQNCGEQHWPESYEDRHDVAPSAITALPYASNGYTLL